MIEWLDTLAPPSALPAAWLLDFDDPGLRRAALVVAPTPDDLRRAASRPSAERENVLVRRALARLCVAHAAGVAVETVFIGWTDKGAPRLAGPNEHFHLSWARRRNHFACALALQPLGVDIEIADGGDIPWNALHRDEAVALRGAEPEAREALFMRIWAAKEAYAKALGEGFRREPASFAARVTVDDMALIDDPNLARRQDVRVFFAPGRESGMAVAICLLPSPSAHRSIR